MSTRIGNTRSIDHFLVLSAGFIVLAVSGVVLAEENERTSITQHHVSGGRDNPDVVRETTEEYEGLVTGGERNKGETRSAFAKPGPGSSVQSVSFDFWIYNADVVLFNDDDRDGYYHGVDLLFDADTVYSHAEVYAVLYLSLEGGPWNEYGVTEDFDIYGSSGTDEYVMVTELMSGYPTGSYDLLIELYDAWDGSFVASYGPEDTSELGYLPLEDFDRDAPVRETQVVISSGSGGGGSIDGWFLALFLLVLFGSGIRRIWRHRNDTLMRIDTPAPIWQTQARGRADPESW